MGRLNIGSLWQGLTGDKDGAGDRIVPPTGFTAQLTLFSAGAMAFLAVFALALALATGRLADRWSSELAGSVTVRVSAPVAEQDALVQSRCRSCRPRRARAPRGCCPRTSWPSCWSRGSGRTCPWTRCPCPP